MMHQLNRVFFFSGDTTARYFMLMQEAMADDRPESLALYVYELNLTTTEWQRSILIDAKVFLLFIRSLSMIHVQCAQNSTILLV